MAEEQMNRESLILSKVQDRAAEFRPVSHLDSILNTLHRLLQPAECDARKAFGVPEYPVLLLVGVPRSGTTLAMQYLASLGEFCYPSNLLARFSRTPYIGALIEKALTDSSLDPHNETSELHGGVSFSSNLGKTHGSRSPNEFSFFWRQHIPNYDPEFLGAEAVEKIDHRGIQTGIAAIESVFGKPFAGKCIILQYNVPDLFKILPNSLFLYVRRKPFYVCQSILLARRRYYEDDRIWWSAKPPEYNELKDLDPFLQIAGQVYYTDQAIARGFSAVPEENRLAIDYESFCDQPSKTYRQIAEKYAALGYEMGRSYCGPQGFECANRLRVTREEAQKLQNAYRCVSGDTSADQGA